MSSLQRSIKSFLSLRDCRCCAPNFTTRRQLQPRNQNKRYGFGLNACKTHTVLIHNHNDVGNRASRCGKSKNQRRQCPFSTFMFASSCKCVSTHSKQEQHPRGKKSNETLRLDRCCRCLRQITNEAKRTGLILQPIFPAQHRTPSDMHKSMSL